MFPGPVRRAQRAVGRHHQAPVTTVGQQLHLGQVGVALYLHNQNTQTPVSFGIPNLMHTTQVFTLKINFLIITVPAGQWVWCWRLTGRHLSAGCWSWTGRWIWRGLSPPASPWRPRSACSLCRRTAKCRPHFWGTDHLLVCEIQSGSHV